MGPPVCSPSLPEQAQKALRVPGNSGKQLQALKNQEHSKSTEMRRRREAGGLGVCSGEPGFTSACRDPRRKLSVPLHPELTSQTKQNTHLCQSGLQGLFPFLGHLHGGPRRPCSKSRGTCGHGAGVAR